jgi:hypothetical protein
MSIQDYERGQDLPLTQAQQTFIAIALVVALVASVAIVIFLPHGGDVNPPLKPKTDSQRVRDVDYTQLTQLLKKIADVTDSKAAQVVLQLQDVFKQIAGLFRNTSFKVAIDPAQSYLCGDPNHALTFGRGGFSANYSSICSRFNSTRFWNDAIDGGLSTSVDFQTAFNGLMWSLIELDNLIAKDP